MKPGYNSLNRRRIHLSTSTVQIVTCYVSGPDTQAFLLIKSISLSFFFFVFWFLWKGFTGIKMSQHKFWSTAETPFRKVPVKTELQNRIKNIQRVEGVVGKRSCWGRVHLRVKVEDQKWAIPGLFLFIFRLFIQLTVNIAQCKFFRWVDTNSGPLFLESTALPTEPQPLPKVEIGSLHDNIYL